MSRATFMYFFFAIALFIFADAIGLLVAHMIGVSP